MRESIYDKDLSKLVTQFLLSTHSDQTLSMLRKGGGVSEDEEKALAPWGWSKNEAVLHWDDRVGHDSSAGANEVLIAETAHANSSSRVFW